MASWLKAAEDLFEVVDRRAKLVVNDLADEQTAPVSNGQGSEVKKTKSNKKAQKKLSINESPISLNSEQPQTSPLTSQVDAIHEKDRSDYLNEDSTTSMTPHGESTSQKNSEKPHNTEKDTPALEIPSEDVQDIEVKYDVGQSVLATTTGADVIASSSKSEEKIESASDIHEEHFSVLPSQGFDVANEAHQDDVANEAHQDDVDQSKESGSLDVPSKHDLKSTSPLNSEPTSNDGSQSRYIVLDTKSELPVKQKQQQEKKADNFPKQIEDQLNEAQGLLKTSISSGQSKEARLARVCAGLSSRLQEYKSENAQLEELLIAERELSKSYEARIKQLQNDVSVSKSEVSRIECNMGEAMAAKNAEIEALVISMDALKKQAASSEGNLASLQATMESMMRNRELTETRMLQAVREELASVERRAEEEHAAHNATKKATMEREVELEHRAMEASSALARIQRMADERAARATELEQKVALLEVECSSLNQELQDLEARARRGQKKSPEDANQMIQVQAWQEEVERARQAQRDAESKLSSLDAEVQKMRVEMASMKRDAEHYSRQEHMELEKRYRELTDLLYYKQTQLEAMASEKAAAEFQLKKEVKRSQEAQVEVERSRVSRRASSTWEEDPEMKALEPLPLHHRHMVGASIQLQKAAKLLDSGAVRATRFLWRYPTARLILLFYLVFVHLFLMYLLHRLQDFADREVTESM